MEIAWKLTRVATGETRTLEDWGIKSATRSLINQGRDTLTLGFPGNDLLGNSPFDYGETLILDRVVGEDDVYTATTVFRGRIIAELRAADGANEGLTVTVAGPWWYLENLVYTQPANFATNISAATAALASGWPLAAQNTSRILFAEDQFRSRVDSRFMVVEALDFAIAKGAPLQYGIIDPGISIPREELSDVTCASIILRSLKWTPGQSLWFDYTTNPPTLVIQERANREVREIDVEDEEIEQVELNPRRDLIVPGVRINYVRRHQRYLMGAEPTYVLTPIEVMTLDPEEAGPDPTGMGALIFTTELFGSTVYQSMVGPPPAFTIVAQEDAPEGIAAALYAAYSALQFEGRIALARQECDDSAWIGLALRMLNGNPAWTERLMDVRQSDDDLFHGRTELTIGPNNQLGPGDLLDLLRKGKTLPPMRGDVIIRDEPNPVPVIPPVPPIPTPPPGSVPPTPPPATDPHTDYDPSLFIVANTRYSGTNTEDVGGFAPPYPGETDYPQLGGDPAYSTVTINASGIGAELAKSAARDFTPGPPPHDFTTNIGKYAEGGYTLTEFDLHLFSTGGPPESETEFTNIASIWLVGTQTKSNADGTNTATELLVEISGGIGGRIVYRAVATLGAIHHVSGFYSAQNFTAVFGSVSFSTLRAFKRPPPPAP